MAKGGGQERLLEGYRVLDLADGKGVYCTKLLADLGADVVIVEPSSGSRGRHRGPFFHDEPHVEKSLYFLYFNTSKRSITLNLEHPDGQAIFKRLAKTADVVVETFPVGYMKSLGLDYDALSVINPKLVMTSISPFGQTGPYKDYKGSDLVAMAMGGYMQITGDPEKYPVRLGNEHSHYPTSQYAALGILGALYYRDITSGRGQYIDMSLFEPIIPYHLEQHQAAMWKFQRQNPIRVGLHSYIGIPLGVYPCKDGWAAALTTTDKEWDGLAQWIYEVTGEKAVLDEELKGVWGEGRRKRRDEVIAYIMRLSSSMTKQEFFHQAQKRDMGFEPVNTPEDILNDPHLAASGFWVELDHPVVGKLRYPRQGPFCGEDIPEIEKAAPLLGEHNKEIYCGELGFTKNDLVVLRSGGII